MNATNEPLSDEDAFALLYRILCFLVCLYLVGDVFCQGCLRFVPSLVGQIAVGLFFGPNGTDCLVTEASYVILSIAGQLGLVLMLCQAGSQMDLELLQKTGLRSVVMAVTGSLLPTAIGFVLAYFVVLDEADFKAALAVGCSFGPTSAGIALAVLEQCHVLQTPIGQLVVAVAIVDDIIALVVLSQLRALTESDVTASQIVLPIVSALLWLGVGSLVAIRGMPVLLGKVEALENKIFNTEKEPTMHTQERLSCAIEDGEHRVTDDVDSTPETSAADADADIQQGDETVTRRSRGNMHVVHATALLLGLLPATYFTEASFFLGAFLAGLALATRPQAAFDLDIHWKEVTTWLMRLFFGATIAFVIPVSLWWEQPQTLANGCLLALSLLGKLAVGPLLTPILQPEGRRWDIQHIRDCLITGCSMAGEAEFAFVVAAFGLSQGLIPESVYASVTFAILLSTIASPVLLRLVLAYTSPDIG